MLAYLLFLIGSVLIICALLSPKKQSDGEVYFSLEKESVSSIEEVSNDMVQHLERVAKNFLTEIDHKSAEIRSLVKEADCLLGKIETAKQDYLSLNKKIRTISPLEEKYQKITQLLDQGKDMVEVAKAMKMGKGEVQLILDLGKTGWKNFESN